MKATIVVVLLALICACSCATGFLKSCYDSTNTRHLYTLSSSCPSGTTVDGDAGAVVVPVSGACTTPYIPLFSFAATGDRVLSTSGSVSGYTKEGTVACVLPSNSGASGSLPLYELYNSATTDHIYTSDDLAIYDYQANGYVLGSIIAKVVGGPQGPYKTS